MKFFKYVVVTTQCMWLCINASADAITPVQQCLLKALARSNPTVTVAQIREQCAQPSPSKPQSRNSDAVVDTAKGVLERRVQDERELNNRSFALTAHRPTYFLPFTYNSRPNTATFPASDPGDRIDKGEAQFQVSFKFPLIQHVFSDDNDLFLALTTRSWWQAYNLDASSPFRDTDYEPEIFIRHYGGPRWGSLRVGGWDFGVAHQSNGQAGALSRSWNRINAGIAFERGNLALTMRAWYRIPENSEDDDNPDLDDYLGYGDMRLLYTHNNHVVSAMFRHGNEKGAIELTWSRPLWQRLRLYALYFDGYGENLLDYNHRSRRFGIGIGLNDFVRGDGW